MNQKPTLPGVYNPKAEIVFRVVVKRGGKDDFFNPEVVTEPADSEIKASLTEALSSLPIPGGLECEIVTIEGKFSGDKVQVRHKLAKGFNFTAEIMALLHHVVECWVMEVVAERQLVESSLTTLTGIAAQLAKVLVQKPSLMAKVQVKLGRPADQLDFNQRLVAALQAGLVEDLCVIHLDSAGGELARSPNKAAIEEYLTAELLRMVKAEAARLVPEAIKAAVLWLAAGVDLEALLRKDGVEVVVADVRALVAAQPALAEVLAPDIQAALAVAGGEGDSEGGDGKAKGATVRSSGDGV